MKIGSVRLLSKNWMDAGEYDHASVVANEAITEAVVRYLHDAMLEEEERQEEREGA